jgi:hypothetical protein
VTEWVSVKWNKEENAKNYEKLKLNKYYSASYLSTCIFLVVVNTFCETRWSSVQNIHK